MSMEKVNEIDTGKSGWCLRMKDGGYKVSNMDCINKT